MTKIIYIDIDDTLADLKSAHAEAIKINPNMVGF